LKKKDHIFIEHKNRKKESKIGPKSLWAKAQKIILGQLAIGQWVQQPNEKK